MKRKKIGRERRPNAVTYVARRLGGPGFNPQAGYLSEDFLGSTFYLAGKC